MNLPLLIPTLTLVNRAIVAVHYWRFPVLAEIISNPSVVHPGGVRLNASRRRGGFSSDEPATPYRPARPDFSSSQAGLVAAVAGWAGVSTTLSSRWPPLA